MSELLDGRALATRLNKALKLRVDAADHVPGLAVVLVGEDPASEVYVGRKATIAKRIGFRHRQITLPANTHQNVLLAVIDDLNQDPEVDGILVQLPLPGGMDAVRVLDRVSPHKDVDGLTYGSAGRLAQGRPHLVPCTPRGVMLLLEDAGITLSGKRAVVLGRSNIVGRPMAMMLEQANCTVTIGHSRTVDAKDLARSAEVLVVAVGQPELVRGDWVRPGAVVVDVGIHRTEDGALVGDVAFEEAAAVASAITPVPGGVGPMTIAMLMENTFRASQSRSQR